MAQPTQCVTSSTHIIGITQYRYKVLRGRVAERACDLIRGICETGGVVVIRRAVSPDHIHMLVSASPQLAPSKLVQYTAVALPASVELARCLAQPSHESHGADLAGLRPAPHEILDLLPHVGCGTEIPFKAPQDFF